MSGEELCLHPVRSPMEHCLDAYEPPELLWGLSSASAEALGTVQVRGLGSVQRAQIVVCLWMEEDGRASWQQTVTR